MSITLHHGDCLEFLKTLDSNSVDLIVSDPPYIMSDAGCGGIIGQRRKYNYLYSEDLKENLRNGFDFKILDECKRVLKTLNLYLFCNKNLLVELLQYFKNDKFDVLIYHKKNPIPSFKYTFLSDLEYIVFVCNDRNLMNNTFKTSSKLFSMNIPIKESLHPTEKPLDIIKTMIMNNSKEEDVVLDMFMGSGTTGMASKALNRKFIGCEIKKEYFKMAEERISKVQGELFR